MRQHQKVALYICTCMLMLLLLLTSPPPVPSSPADRVVQVRQVNFRSARSVTNVNFRSARSVTKNANFRRSHRVTNLNLRHPTLTGSLPGLRLSRKRRFSREDDHLPLFFFVADSSDPIRQMGFVANARVGMNMHDIERCTFSSGFREGLPELLDSRSDFQMQKMPNYQCFVDRFLKNSRCLLPSSKECGRCPPWDPESPKIVKYTCQQNHWLNVAFRSVFLCDRGVVNGQLSAFLSNKCERQFFGATDKSPPKQHTGAIGLIGLLIYYTKCIEGLLFYDCPDPCLIEFACSGEHMLSQCYATVIEENHLQRRIRPIFSWLRPAFRRVAVCRCTPGFQFDLEANRCNRVALGCSRGDECGRGGECEQISQEMGRILGREYNCKCRPAWSGIRCEQPRDPCLHSLAAREACGSNSACRRNSADAVNGYTCDCLAGFALNRRLGIPACVDVNECARGSPCRNGGLCVNVIGSFRCECNFGYTGDRCEILPLLPHWLPWQQWTPCSVTCSTGLQSRRRNCTRRGCEGLASDFRECVGRLLTCVHSAAADPAEASTVVSNKDLPFQHDDAFFSREYQRLSGLRPEVERRLLIGCEESLVYAAPIMLPIAALQLLILLRCCRLASADRKESDDEFSVEADREEDGEAENL